MNKTAIVIAIIIALILLGMPLATGMVAENALEQRVEAMDQNAWLSAEILSYERRWFSSEARVELGLSPGYVEQLRDLADMPATIALLTEPLVVLVELDHGPVSLGDSLHIGVARVRARPDPAQPAVAALEQNLGIPYLFEFRGRAGFGNRFDFDADVPPIDYAGPFGQADFTGLDVEGFATIDTLTVEARSEQLNFQNPFSAAVLDSLAFEADYLFRQGDLPLGTVAFGVDRISISSILLGAEPIFALEDLSISSTLELDDRGERLDATNLYSVASLSAGNGLALTDVEVGLGVFDIAAGATSTYYTIMADAAARGVDDVDTIFASLQPVIDELVMSGLSVSAEPVRFSTDTGSLDGRVVIEIDGSSLAPGMPVDIRNIAVLLGVISADADLSVSKPLARELAVIAMRAQATAAASQGGVQASPEEIAAMAEAQAGLVLVSLVGRGVLLDDGERYSVALDFSNGGILVNGEPLPLDLL